MTASADVLRVDDLGISFGGIHALQNVTFAIEPGRIVGLMGPNGAGKTTLFNIISGLYRPSSGTVRFGGAELQTLKPAQVCRAGIGRTFQSGRPFGPLTVRENVLVGLYYGSGPEPRRVAELRAQEILAFVGLASQADRRVSSLSLMERKFVELARALATRPRLLLLDELLAGLNPIDLGGAIRTICRIRDEFGITILWIEHIMKVLMETCEHVIVLHHGQKLAEGTPRDVAADRVVADAYFGKMRH
jgi:branched-chain amino acid transport system ATP-binding protein